MVRGLPLILIPLLVGCASIPTLPSAAQQSVIAHSWPYAMISYNAYHREAGNSASPAFDLPDRFTLDLSRDNDDIGLAYDILRERRVDGDYLVVAFRGTETPPDGHDWRFRTNCDWVHGNWQRHQQERAVDLIKAELAARGVPEERVIFTGHSLGAAIAMHVSYRVPDSWVFIFNSSPRFEKPRPYVISDTDMPPYRRMAVAQRFEALRFLRGAGKEKKKYYLPMQCVDGSPVDRHSMRPLALCLTRFAAGGGSVEAFAAMEQNADLFSPSPPRDVERIPPTCEDER